VSDFNSDGAQDLATANSTANSVSVLLGNGNGTFRTAVAFPGLPSAVSLAAADLNFDGKPDLAVVSRLNPGVVTILINNTP
jgi:hypothetical protein